MTNIIIKKSSKTNITHVFYQNEKIPCKIGKNGIGIKTREGDMITPKGIFKFQKVFFRNDRAKKPACGIPRIKIRKSFIWSTDPRDKKYNSLLKKPGKYLHERLYRKDHLYNIIVTTSFNLNPTKKFRGSAIFVHCAENKKNYTEGCIAIEQSKLCEMLQFISPVSFLIIV